MRESHFTAFNAFVTIVDHASFTKAAQHLGISASTLSQAIRELEDWLDVRLLNRTTRSVAPTEAGERLLAKLRPLLTEFDAAVESVRAYRDKPAGLVRLTVNPHAASFVLAPVLRRFLAAYPDIRLDISVGPPATKVDIIAEHFDAGISAGEVIDRDMIAVRISEPIRRIVVAAPSYLRDHPAPQTPRDLAQHNAILYRLPSGGFLPWRFEENGKSFESTPEGSLSVNDPSVAVRAALDGIGLLYATWDYLREAITAGTLVQVLEDWEPRDRTEFFLYYPSRRHVPAPLQALINFLRDNFKSGKKDARPSTFASGNDRS
jgi:LysR family transcriptional regulator, regulator of peptidoglycan recycling